MKKIFTALTATMLLLTSMGCGASSSSTPSPSPSPSSSVSTSAGTSQTSSVPAVNDLDTSFYSKLLLIYGAEAKTDELGKTTVHPTQGYSLYNAKDWSDADPLTCGDYFTWYYSQVLANGSTPEENAKTYKSPIGEDRGLFFPRDEYETAIMDIFNVTKDELRSDILYYKKQFNGYTLDAGPGIGASSTITLDRVEPDGELQKLYITLSTDAGVATQKILSVAMADDGTFKFKGMATIAK